MGPSRPASPPGPPRIPAESDSLPPMQVFPVAPMSPVIRTLTILLLALPPLFVAVGLHDPGPTRPLMVGVGLLVAGLYLGIWLWARPSRFEVTEDRLVLVWPLRRRAIPRSEIDSTLVVDLAGFRAAYGRPIRIGAGGLFGTFGWLWSRRSGRLDVYATNLGPWVVIERRAARPLILSPADCDGFAAALQR